MTSATSKSSAMSLSHRLEQDKSEPVSNVIYKEEDRMLSSQVVEKHMSVLGHPGEGVVHVSDLTVLSPSTSQIIHVLSSEDYPLGLTSNRRVLKGLTMFHRYGSLVKHTFSEEEIKRLEEIFWSSRKSTPWTISSLDDLKDFMSAQAKEKKVKGKLYAISDDMLGDKPKRISRISLEDMKIDDALSKMRERGRSKGSLKGSNLFPLQRKGSTLRGSSGPKGRDLGEITTSTADMRIFDPRQTSARASTSSKLSKSSDTDKLKRKDKGAKSHAQRKFISAENIREGKRRKQDKSRTYVTPARRKSKTEKLLKMSSLDLQESDVDQKILTRQRERERRTSELERRRLEGVGSGSTSSVGEFSRVSTLVESDDVETKMQMYLEDEQLLDDEPEDKKLKDSSDVQRQKSSGPALHGPRKASVRKLTKSASRTVKKTWSKISTKKKESLEGSETLLTELYANKAEQFDQIEDIEEGEKETEVREDDIELRILSDADFILPASRTDSITEEEMRVKSQRSSSIAMTGKMISITPPEPESLKSHSGQLWTHMSKKLQSFWRLTQKGHTKPIGQPVTLDAAEVPKAQKSDRSFRSEKADRAEKAEKTDTKFNKCYTGRWDDEYDTSIMNELILKAERKTSDKLSSKESTRTSSGRLSLSTTASTADDDDKRDSLERAPFSEVISKKLEDLTLPTDLQRDRRTAELREQFQTYQGRRPSTDKRQDDLQARIKSLFSTNVEEGQENMVDIERRASGELDGRGVEGSTSGQREGREADGMTSGERAGREEAYGRTSGQRVGREADGMTSGQRKRREYDGLTSSQREGREGADGITTGQREGREAADRLASGQRSGKEADGMTYGTEVGREDDGRTYGTPERRKDDGRTYGTPEGREDDGRTYGTPEGRETDGRRSGQREGGEEADGITPGTQKRREADLKTSVTPDGRDPEGLATGQTESRVKLGLTGKTSSVQMASKTVEDVAISPAEQDKPVVPKESERFKRKKTLKSDLKGSVTSSTGLLGLSRDVSRTEVKKKDKVAPLKTDTLEESTMVLDQLVNNLMGKLDKVGPRRKKSETRKGSGMDAKPFRDESLPEKTRRDSATGQGAAQKRRRESAYKKETGKLVPTQEEWENIQADLVGKDKVETIITRKDKPKTKAEKSRKQSTLVTGLDTSLIQLEVDDLAENELDVMEGKQRRSGASVVEESDIEEVRRQQRERLLLKESDIEQGRKGLRRSTTLGKSDSDNEKRHSKMGRKYRGSSTEKTDADSRDQRNLESRKSMQGKSRAKDFAKMLNHSPLESTSILGWSPTSSMMFEGYKQSFQDDDWRIPGADKSKRQSTEDLQRGRRLAIEYSSMLATEIKEESSKNLDPDLQVTESNEEVETIFTATQRSDHDSEEEVETIFTATQRSDHDSKEELETIFTATQRSDHDSSDGTDTAREIPRRGSFKEHSKKASTDKSDMSDSFDFYSGTEPDDRDFNPEDHVSSLIQMSLDTIFSVPEEKLKDVERSQRTKKKKPGRTPGPLKLPLTAKLKTKKKTELVLPNVAAPIKRIHFERPFTGWDINKPLKPRNIVELPGLLNTIPQLVAMNIPKYDKLTLPDIMHKEAEPRLPPMSESHNYLFQFGIVELLEYLMVNLLIERPEQPVDFLLDLTRCIMKHMKIRYDLGQILVQASASYDSDLRFMDDVSEYDDTESSNDVTT